METTQFQLITYLTWPAPVMLLEVSIHHHTSILPFWFQPKKSFYCCSSAAAVFAFLDYRLTYVQWNKCKLLLLHFFFLPIKLALQDQNETWTLPEKRTQSFAFLCSVIINNSYLFPTKEGHKQLVCISTSEKHAVCSLCCLKDHIFVAYEVKCWI